MDQEVARYETFEDLLYYCDHSANPCGRLFLYVFDYRDEERQQLSDYTCTALQLTNFWQDVNRDWQKGRIYLPLEDMKAHGVTEEQLDHAHSTTTSAGSWPSRWNGLVGCSARARSCCPV